MVATEPADAADVEEEGGFTAPLEHVRASHVAALRFEGMPRMGGGLKFP